MASQRDGKRAGRRRRSRAAVALVCATALVTGCPRCIEAPTATSPLRDAGASPDAMRRAALLSVYYHAWIVDHPPPEVGPTPIPLKEAATILRDDTDAQAVPRRRRAIVKLTVYGTKCAAHRKAVAILLGPVTEGVQDDLEAEVARAKEGTTSSLAAEEKVEAYLREKNIPPEMAAAGTCTTTFPLTMVRYDPFLGDTWAETRFRVQAPLDAVAASLDPQNWARCNSFFKASYVIDQTGGSVANHCWSEKKDPPLAPVPPIAGGSWSGMLFEHFVFDFGVEWSWFRNQLDVRATRDERQYRFRYDLYDSLCSRVLFDTASGGFGIDGGYLEVTPSTAQPGWSEVAASKKLSFTGRPLMDLYLDWWSPVLLWLLGDETAQEACCLPPVSGPKG
jgi:hypothetical protein